MSRFQKEMIIRLIFVAAFVVFALIVLAVSRAHGQWYGGGPFSGSESRTVTTNTVTPGNSIAVTTTRNDSWSGLNYRPSSQGSGGRSWGSGNRGGDRLIAFGVGLVGGMLLDRALNSARQPRCATTVIPGHYEQVWRQTGPSFWEASDVWVPEQVFRSCR